MKQTSMQKLDNALINNKCLRRNKCLSKEFEKNENTAYQNIWNVAKVYQICFV